MTEDALRRELRQREAWLRASNELTSALLSGRPADETLRLVARRAAEISQAPFVAVVLADPDPQSDLLVFEVIDNSAAAALAGRRMSVTGSLTGKVFSTGQPCVVDELWTHASESSVDLLPQDVPEELRKLRSAVLVPLRSPRAVLGVLVIAREDGQDLFVDSDVEMVSTFAAHAALAVEAARVQRDQQRLAVFEERDRIARELHDKVIQRLFTIGLGLQSLTRLVAKPEVGRRVAAFADELDQTIRDIRRTIFDSQDRSG